MFKKNTVFILGAGSNCEIGFPTGKSLLNDILNNFVPIPKTKLLLANFPSNEANLKNDIIGQTIKLGEILRAPHTFSSIDQLLAFHPKNELAGKIAIANSIIKGERISKDSDYSVFYKCIFNELVSTIRTPENINDFLNNKLTIVTFNYDRSLEYYLIKFVRHFSDILASISDTELISKQIPIYHVYGSLGSICKDDSNYLEYGAEINAVNLYNASKSIDVIYGKKQIKRNIEIQDALKNAEAIFFIGFGYDDDNLKKLNLPEVLAKKCYVFGTGVDASDELIQTIDTTFKPVTIDLGQPIVQKGLNCIELMNNVIKKYVNKID